LSIFLVPSQSLNTPLYLESAASNEHTPTPSPSIVFTFGLAVKSIKELGGASLTLGARPLNCYN